MAARLGPVGVCRGTCVCGRSEPPIVADCRRRRVGSGKRMTFGESGEATLSQWMADNVRVCWVEEYELWTLESQLISQLDLPLLGGLLVGNLAFLPQRTEAYAPSRQSRLFGCVPG
ncbi:GIY-YIG nuclease family protein [Streptomyces sp. NPDC001228]|uniref:GIY-YIG nuclease family protein n=1 Tax=Streptomyces sp. NPDC001228 TaxID=3154381 RepID=UPI00333054DF